MLVPSSFEGGKEGGGQAAGQYFFLPSKVNDERETTDATGCSFSDLRGRTCSMRVLQPSFERLDEVLLGIASPLSRSTSRDVRFIWRRHFEYHFEYYYLRIK